MEYRYDAWGRQTSKTGPKASSLGTINPFRYRGYVLDEDIGLYYLRSRYYNPWWGRFISVDAAIGRCGGINQHNLFAYCLNNVMNCSDANGKKVYVLNGINNTSDNGLAPSIKNFCTLLENENVENIVPITTYWTEEGESVIDDLQEYWVESSGGTVYTDYVISEIERDLMQNPLMPGESINIIGYSGSGIIALEVAAAMQEKIANVVLVGAPILYFEGNLKAKVHAFWSWGDILYWNITKNISTYCVGISGHTEYFREDVVTEIAQIVR